MKQQVNVEVRCQGQQPVHKQLIVDADTTHEAAYIAQTKFKGQSTIVIVRGIYPAPKEDEEIKQDKTILSIKKK